MKEEIQKALEVLVGLPLWAVGRAADLAWLHFGNRRLKTTVRGETTEVGEYALHLQCAWRITRDDRIVTGRGDIFCTPEETEEPTPEDFDWQQGNRFDRIVEQLFPEGTQGAVVQQVAAGDAGSFTIVLEGGYKLEVFPQDSESGEHWRLFKPSSGPAVAPSVQTTEPHFVVTGKGVEIE